MSVIFVLLIIVPIELYFAKSQIQNPFDYKITDPAISITTPSITTLSTTGLITRLCSVKYYYSKNELLC